MEPGLEQLREFAPQWVLYWGQRMSRHQYAIWEPYLRRSRHRFLVLVDGPGAVPDEVQAAAADLPNVAFAHSRWPKERLNGVRSLRGVLYVGHRPHNPGAIAALPGATHVFIGHGNSGKRASGARTHLQYDSHLVASYRDLRRWPRAAREGLRLQVCAIGAPVVEGLGEPPPPRPTPERPRVLYLPTWEGNADYSSLGVVLAALRKAPPAGCEELTMRCHPGTGRKRPEVLALREGVEAFTTGPPLDKAAAMLRADVAVCDISGATSEFLFTRKPIVMPWGPHLSAKGLTRQRLRKLYPFASLWDVEEQSFDEAVHAALHDEVVAERRRRAADEVFRGHRTLDEAVRTFDLALSVMPLRRTRIPLRVLFEARMRAAAVLGR